MRSSIMHSPKKPYAIIFGGNHEFMCLFWTYQCVQTIESKQTNLENESGFSLVLFQEVLSHSFIKF